MFLLVDSGEATCRHKVLFLSLQNYSTKGLGAPESRRIMT
jgi:hypothetical protein